MTNPNISILNDALEQLGITLTDNLSTMGINDADLSNGLITLAGEILNIKTEDNVSISTAITYINL